MEERSYLSFSGSSTRSVCGKIYMFFFQRKRKSQRRVASKKYRYLLFRRSSISFFLFFPFIYTQRHSPFRLRLLLPGWCLNQPRGGDFVPFWRAEEWRCSFFRGKRRAKRRWQPGRVVPFFFATSVPSFSFREKLSQKADGVRWNRPLPFRGLRPLPARGKMHAGFFRGKGKTKRG